MLNGSVERLQLDIGLPAGGLQEYVQDIIIHAAELVDHFRMIGPH